jgi:hypothetical protein
MSSLAEMAPPMALNACKPRLRLWGSRSTFFAIPLRAKAEAPVLRRHLPQHLPSELEWTCSCESAINMRSRQKSGPTRQTAIAFSSAVEPARSVKAQQKSENTMRSSFIVNLVAPRQCFKILALCEMCMRISQMPCQRWFIVALGNRR